MADQMELKALELFYRSKMREIRDAQEESESGAFQEQIFTEFAAQLLSESGESENVYLAYYENALGTRNQVKINGYAIYDNYETVDIFITVFRQEENLINLPAQDLETAQKRIHNFLVKCKHNTILNNLEPSSEIFDFANTMISSNDLRENLVRINCIILTNCKVSNNNLQEHVIKDYYPIHYRVIDIEHLYNISEKNIPPIEIDFSQEGFRVPCISSANGNSKYSSYLAIMPAQALNTIYERYGARLLEQNVRSFLQFSGKINKGIRKTILEEPDMFMAYNNGLSTTAESIEVKDSDNGAGKLITKIKNFQIVNGGQTTASLYHTSKKGNADLSRIFVQVKISVINDRIQMPEIVSRISEYANTQNKVSVSDLSSNSPFHIELEKLSRNIYTQVTDSNRDQTRWFYERARGQYKNARNNALLQRNKLKLFERSNPKSQMFTKEDLAKYINAFNEVSEGRRIVVGPHFVVRGNQKNYIQFLNYNTQVMLDNVYFEDMVAKAIIFKSAEKIYGIKPNAIGDMRFITVPYAISYLNFRIGNSIDLFNIWKNQRISENLTGLLKDLMVHCENFIKNSAPGNLYSEWAKKEECWVRIRQENFIPDIKDRLADDLIDPKSAKERKRYSIQSTSNMEESLQRIKAVPVPVWKHIESYGREHGLILDHESTAIFAITAILIKNGTLSEHQIKLGTAILDKVINKFPEILEEIEKLPEVDLNKTSQAPEFEITIDLVKKAVIWDRSNNRLKQHEHSFMLHLSDGRNQFTERNKEIAKKNILKLQKYGFQVEE